jgi:hypothetical protein
MVGRFWFRVALAAKAWSHSVSRWAAQVCRPHGPFPYPCLLSAASAAGLTAYGFLLGSSALLLWLKTVLMALPKLGRIAIAARAMNVKRRAYSIKSCPDSSFQNAFSDFSIFVSPYCFSDMPM